MDPFIERVSQKRETQLNDLRPTRSALYKYPVKRTRRCLRWNEHDVSHPIQTATATDAISAHTALPDAVMVSAVSGIRLK